MGKHIIDGEFQSDKYDWSKRGFVPLKVTDPMAQPVLWEYAQWRRSVDAEFADDLEAALRAVGFVPESTELRCNVTGNPCGSDTWAVGRPCQCAPCQQYLDERSPPCPVCAGRGQFVGVMGPQRCENCRGSGRSPVAKEH